MLNKVQIIGRLGKPVEIKYSQAGNAIASFSVATDESYTDKNGQRQEATEWHNVVAFGKTADICGKYLDKGSLVYVEGKLRTRKWQDRDGRDRYVTEIYADNVRFLERKHEQSSMQERAVTSRQQRAPQPEQQQDFDMDMPPF